MKKLFAIILALCLFAALLPMTVLADGAAISVQFRNTVSGFSGFTLSLNPGDVMYVTTNESMAFVKWTGAEAPADNFIKLEYPAEGEATLKATFKNIKHESTTTGYTADSIDFASGDYAIQIELIGTNVMNQRNSAVMESYAAKGMTFTGEGSLEVVAVGSVHGSIINRSGDVVIKNTNLKFNVDPGNSSLHHAIFSTADSVVIEGSKIESVTKGGRLVYLGVTDKEAGGAGKGRYTPSTDEARTITVKNSEITAKAEKGMFQSAAPINIENSTLKMTLSGSNGSIFNKSPNFIGEYTAIAGLAKNADKLDKLKVYDAKKLSSYTYMYIVPGIQDLLPTEPETTVPEITVPEETTPEITTPEETTPDATTPDTTTPDATTPESKPAQDNTPSESKPADNKPAESKPAQADKDVEEDGEGNSLTVVLIIMIVVLVAAGAAFGILIYLKKKKAN